MCFICTQTRGFETDIKTIIDLNKNPTININSNDNSSFSEISTDADGTFNESIINTNEELIDSELKAHHLVHNESWAAFHQNTLNNNIINIWVDSLGESTSFDDVEIDALEMPEYKVSYISNVLNIVGINSAILNQISKIIFFITCGWF